MSGPATNGLDAAIAFLERLPALIDGAAAAGLERAMGSVTDDAQNTVRYQDETGATRASTIAYVADGGGGGGELAGAAYAAAEELNPDFAHVEEAADPAGEHGVSLVLTTYTRYTADLITMQGGARDFIGATMTQHAGSLHDAACAGVAELFGGGQ